MYPKTCFIGIYWKSGNNGEQQNGHLTNLQKEEDNESNTKHEIKKFKMNIKLQKMSSLYNDVKFLSV